MECGLGFWDLVHNYSHFITSVLHNFGSALYIQINKRFARIPRILRSYDTFYCEIDEYNSTYLSKFLLIIWIFLGGVCVLFIYMIVFGDLFIFIRIVLFYGALFPINIFNFIFTTACSLNKQANEAYTKLNSLYLRYINTFKIRKRLQVTNKVNIIKIYK